MPIGKKLSVLFASILSLLKKDKISYVFSSFFLLFTDLVA